MVNLENAGRQMPDARQALCRNRASEIKRSLHRKQAEASRAVRVSKRQTRCCLSNLVTRSPPRFCFGAPAP